MNATKSTLTVLASILYLTTFGQVLFEAGYIVSNNGEKLDCLIENKDWIYNPETFLYKLSQEDPPKVGTVNDFREFGVYNYSRFIRATVELDTSNVSILSRLSHSRKPHWSSKTLFLKAITTGSANLYRYQNDDVLAFFFNTSLDSTIRQLIHKIYYTKENKVGRNVDFKQQLINEVLCDESVKNSISKMGYRERDLRKYFHEYNTCNGDVIQQITPKISAYQQTRGFLNFKLTPGISYNSVSVQDDRKHYPGPQINFDFENRFVFRAGIEIEYILPFNKNKWGIFFEPTFQYFEGSENYRWGNSSGTGTINYRSLEFPIGFRYYSFLKKGGIFFNLILLPSNFIDLENSQITLSQYLVNIRSIETKIGFSLGGGYTWGPFGLEARYYIPQNLVYNEPSFHAPYQRLTLITSIKFVSIKKSIKE